MTLREKLELQGNWLFRRRSYLPLLLLPLLLAAIYSSDYSTKTLGYFSDELWTIMGLLIAFGGLGIRVYTIAHVPQNTSGRNTSRQRAETINTTGIYSIVRHPLYLGNFIIIFGMTLSVHVWWFTLIMIFAFWIHYERIMFAEEEFLQKNFGSAFLQWAEHTPAFFPKFQLWKPPSLPFSLRTVLKREYSGFFGIIVAFTGIDIIKTLLSERTLKIHNGWLVFFIIGGLIYLALRTLRKKTKLFHVEGR
jgi:protein-S-isoprenylcysteine O-methyltransferase Ste14